MPSDLLQMEALTMIEVLVPENGKEVLWGEVTNGGTRVLSVPVFAYGISRNAIVDVETHGARARLVSIIRPSEGATIRCYSNGSISPSVLYQQQILSAALRLKISVGPATFFNPDIVAFHLASRANLPVITSALDQLANEGKLHFWELGDPDTEKEDVSPSAHEKAWELVHQLPIDGESGSVDMH